MVKCVVSLFIVIASIFLPNLILAKGLIPYPQKVVPSDGFFKFKTQITFFSDKDLLIVFPFYKKVLEEGLGVEFIKSNMRNAQILFKIKPDINLIKEGYRLNITRTKIEIEASSKEGIFYGIQSLLQLVEEDESVKIVKAISIEDVPRFRWRGLMLDVSRTFIPVPLVKRYIDLMSYYKLNILHLHLTDDQGWRIEIEKYPKLITKGSKFDSEFNEMGGYYSKEEIKGMIEYAAQKNVTIIPEIDLPGHTCAMIASYPELSCRNIVPKIHPYEKGPGIHKEILCAGKPEVYKFIFNVLDEVLELFPSEYIHIGGDEAPKDEWKTCMSCQQAIKNNSLKNEEELQGLFVRKIGSYLESKERMLIGWDEILDGGQLLGNEIVMYWRGWLKDRIPNYVNKGFKIISSPTSYCYFDYSYNSIDTKRVYSYDPVPEDCPAEKLGYYWGVQANFWSHLDKSENRIDRQLFPRILALAEVAWTFPENKSWERFSNSAIIHNEYLRKLNVNTFNDTSLY